MGITHATAATGSDSGDGKISKNAWNESHVISGENFGFIGCKVKRTSAEPMTTSDFTALPFDDSDSEVFDTDGFHSVGTNPSRLTVPVGLGGKYLCTATVIWDTDNDAGIRAITLRVNGSGTFGRNDLDVGGASGSLAHTQTTTTVLDLAAGQYVTLDVYHNVGGALDVDADTDFSIVKLDSGHVGQGVGASVYRSTDQTIANTTPANITFDSEYFDTDGFHSTSVNTDRLTIPAGLSGKYLITASGRWASDSDGSRVAWLKSSVRALATSIIAPGAATEAAFTVSAVADLVAGDYVYLVGYHSGGGNLDIGPTAGYGDPLNMSIMRLDAGNAATPSLIHTHSVTTEHTGTSCGGAWTDLSDNTTFTKVRNSSMLRVTGRFAAQARETTSGEDLAGARVVIDSAGTPQYLMLASMLFNDTMGNNYWMLQGGATTHLTGLAAGSHTVKIQAITGPAGTGDIYLRPSTGTPYEYGVVEIVEE